MDQENHPGLQPHPGSAQNWTRYRSIATWILVVAGILFLVGAQFRQAKQFAPRPSAPVQVGAPFGEFELADLNGKTVRLSNYKGKPVLINAWATWCPPCRTEMPLLNQYYQEHARDGLVILAVNAGDSQKDAAAFAQEYRLSFPVLLDSDVKVIGTHWIDDLPTTILVGKDGIVKRIHIGALTPEMIESEITPLLSQ